MLTLSPLTPTEDLAVFMQDLTNHEVYTAIINGVSIPTMKRVFNADTEESFTVEWLGGPEQRVSAVLQKNDGDRCVTLDLADETQNAGFQNVVAWSLDQIGVLA